MELLVFLGKLSNSTSFSFLTEDEGGTIIK